jgi:hypothetical protein
MFLTGRHLSEQSDAVIRWRLECITEGSIANQKGIAMGLVRKKDRSAANNEARNQIGGRYA